MTPESEIHPSNGIPSYAKWTASIKDFEKIAKKERRDQLVKDGVRLFHQTMKTAFEDPNKFETFNLSLNTPDEFKAILSHGNTIIGFEQRPPQTEPKLPLRFTLMFYSEGNLGITVPEPQKDGVDKVSVTFEESFQFESPYGRIVEQPHMVKASNLEIVKVINWAAHDAVRERQAPTQQTT